MPVALVGLLMLFWTFLSYRAFEGGDATMGIVYLAIGAALTAYRLRSRAK